MYSRQMLAQTLAYSKWATEMANNIKGIKPMQVQLNAESIPNYDEDSTNFDLYKSINDDMLYIVSGSTMFRVMSYEVVGDNRDLRKVQATYKFRGEERTNTLHDLTIGQWLYVKVQDTDGAIMYAPIKDLRLDRLPNP